MYPLTFDGRARAAGGNSGQPPLLLQGNTQPLLQGNSGGIYLSEPALLRQGNGDPLNQGNGQRIYLSVDNVLLLADSLGNYIIYTGNLIRAE